MTSRSGRALAVFVVAIFLAWTDGRAQTDVEPVSSLVAGRAAFEDGLYELAEKHFARRLQAVESDASVAPEAVQEAARYMGQALLAQGKYAEMLEWFRADRSLGKRLRDPGLAVFWRAYGHWGLGHTDLALKELDGFEKRFSSGEYAARARRLRATCLLKADRLGAALKEYDAYDKDYGQSAEAAENLLDWSRALLLTNGVDRACELLLRIKTMAPPAPVLNESDYWLGQVYMRQGDVTKADGVFAALAGNERVPGEQRVRAWYALAGAYTVATNTERRIVALKEGLALTRLPEMKQRGEKELGSLLLDLGKVEEGIPYLKSFVAAAPQSPDADGLQMRVAQAFMSAGQATQALAEFQYYLETFTNVAGQANAYEGKGWTLESLKRPAEGAAAFQKAFGLSADPAQREKCLFKVGDCQFQGAQYRLASDMYGRFLAEFPESARRPRAMYQLAESLFRLGKDEEAAVRFWELALKFPEDGLAAESLVRSGELYSRLNQMDKALDAFNRVLEMPAGAEWYPRALLGRGQVRHNLLEFGDALADFERILSQYPSNAVAEQAFARKGQCLYWVGRDREAMAASREFISRYTNSSLASGVLFWIGKQEFSRGQFAPAEEAFVAVATRFPTNSLADDALLWAGLSASRRKEYERAVELLGRLAEQYPGSPKLPEARFAQGEAQTEMSKFDTAILIFDEIIRLQPESELAARAWGRKGDCQFSLGSGDPKRFEDSLVSYRVVANSSAAEPDLVIQAQFKIGRCLEKLGKAQEAFDQYYTHVIVRYFQDREKGVWHGESGKTWFSRAARQAVEMLESAKEWKRAVRIYERIVESGVPEATWAKERIEKIKAEQWWLFR